MSTKRFIDDSILPKTFRKLEPSLKLTWYYIWNNCDAAGIWEIDEDLFEFENGFELDLKSYEESFGGLIEISEEKELVLIADFIAINQCNFNKLNKDYNPHKPVFRSIAKNQVKLNPSLNQASFRLVVEEEVVVVEEVIVEVEKEEDELKEKPKPKPKKPKPKIPTEQEFIEYGLEKHSKADKEKVRLKYLAWKEAGWKSGKDSTNIKNWKTTLLNTLAFLEKTNYNGDTNPGFSTNR